VEDAVAFFDAELFDFLRDLAANNDREWFTANKARYQAVVQEPLLAFIAAFAKPLREISPAFVADPRPSGGSMFRIYRDTRFSNDKSPYKTHAAAQFRHREGRDVHAPGFYLHLEPGNPLCGAGIWHPDGSTLGRLRDAIVDSPEAWRTAVAAVEAGDPRQRRGGDSLKRPPRGYDPGHPLIDDLKRKDHVTFCPLTEADVLAHDVVERVAAAFRPAIPYVRFLCQALDLDF
jgi:uncharacterized protein (TIGR02453 family)